MTTHGKREQPFTEHILHSIIEQLRSITEQLRSIENLLLTLHPDPTRNQPRAKTKTTPNPLRERHGSPWRSQEENDLTTAFDSGMLIEDLAKTHKRSEGSIISRLQKLGKLPKPYWHNRKEEPPAQASQ